MIERAPTVVVFYDSRANRDCYACHGTGRIVGFGFGGEPCPCLNRCPECKGPTVIDEGRAVPCSTCRGEDVQP